MIYFYLVKYIWDVMVRGNYIYIYIVNIVRFCSNENDFFFLGFIGSKIYSICIVYIFNI